MKKNFTTFMALMASLLISAHCFAQDRIRLQLKSGILS